MKTKSKRTRAGVGRLSKRKGKEFEQELAQLIRAAGIDTKRGWWQSRGGSEVPDLIVDGFWLEASTGATVSPEKKLQQAIDQSTQWVRNRNLNTAPFPVAVTRKKGSRTILATVRFGDLSEAISGARLRGSSDLPVSFNFDALIGIIKERQAKIAQADPVGRRTNGGQLCDNDDGACACGAWHRPTDAEVQANPVRDS